MRSRRNIFIILMAVVLAASTGCVRKQPQPRESSESVVLAEGSTDKPEYYVDEEGNVIYNRSRSGIAEGTESGHNTSLPPVFPGAQRIHPSGEDESLRESYITRAPFDAVEQYYMQYLRHGEMREGENSNAAEAIVNSIVSRDENGRKQSALFINKDSEVRAGLKVMIKEFPTQNAVQIILTNLDATPPGLNPYGMWVSPEEAQEWAENYAREQAELERQRQEAESQALNSEDNEEDASAESDSGDGD